MLLAEYTHVYQPKEPVPHEPAGDGVVHHALAFSTLLSSQETDACSAAPRDDLPRALQGVTSACQSYQVRPDPVKFGRVAERSRALSPGQPSELTVPAGLRQINRFSRSLGAPTAPADTVTMWPAAGSKGVALGPVRLTGVRLAPGAR
ncbi:hypothetical protein GCM10023259_047580 [Thermocatellispora tengchongensis]